MHPSNLLVESVEVVRGMPQRVLKIPLENFLDHGLVGLALPDLLDRIIIGPCDVPAVVYQALTRLLSEVCVSNAETRVFVSDIPLRHT